MPIGHLTVPYKGLLQTDLYTYTTTYSPIASGWDFNAYSIMAMESYSAIDSNNANNTVGLRGRVIEKITGYTDYSIGTVSGIGISLQTDQSRGNTYWQGGSLKSLFYIRNVNNTPEPYWNNTLCILGTPVNDPTLLGTNLKVLPNLSNTTSPAPFNSQGFSILGGTPPVESTLFSYRIDLQDNTGYVSDTGLASGHAINGILSSTKQMQAAVPYNDANYFLVNDNNSQGDLVKIIIGNSDFVNGTVNQWTATFQNPPGSLDVNTLFHTAGSFTGYRPSIYGYIKGYSNTVTVEGQTLAGYLLLLLPDLSGYYVIRVNPKDSQANNWKSSTIDTHIDYGEIIWIKRGNSDSVIYYSQQKLSLQFPYTIYPQSPQIFYLPKVNGVLK